MIRRAVRRVERGAVHVYASYATAIGYVVEGCCTGW